MEATLVRRWLFFAMALSLAANVGHTVLADSTIPTWLRMIGAVAWPLLVYGAVDITVKVAWDLIHGRRGGVWLAKLLILIPGIPALITSYEHMHAVLLAMGERPFIAMIGPGAVDLFMIGATITLVLLQRTARLGQESTPAPAEAAEALAETTRPPMESPPPAPRRQRAASGNLEAAVTLLLEGEKTDAAATVSNIGVSTLRRYARVIRMMRTGHEVDARHVRPELVDFIRARLAVTP